MARSTMGFESIFVQEGLSVAEEDLKREIKMGVDQFKASGSEYDQEKLHEQALETCKVASQQLLHLVQDILLTILSDDTMSDTLRKQPSCCCVQLHICLCELSSVRLPDTRAECTQLRRVHWHSTAAFYHPLGRNIHLDSFSLLSDNQRRFHSVLRSEVSVLCQVSRLVSDAS